MVIICLAFWYFKYVFGWLEFQKNTDTPEEYLSHVQVSKSNYSRDSIKILSQLIFLLHNHDQSFYLKYYSDSTELIIDSILYSPGLNRLAVIVFAKNPLDKQVEPNNKFEFYYDGSCYLGVLQNDTIEVNWMDDFFYPNYHDERKLSKTIKEFCFRTFTSIKDYDGKTKYKYNLNDIRFWDGPVWKEIEENKIKKEKFEELKKTHPEDVYEPK